MLGKTFLNVEPSDSRLLATEAPFGPLVLQEAANEVIEEALRKLSCMTSGSVSILPQDIRKRSMG